MAGRPPRDAAAGPPDRAAETPDAPAGPPAPAASPAPAAPAAPVPAKPVSPAATGTLAAPRADALPASSPPAGAPPLDGAQQAPPPARRPWAAVPLEDHTGHLVRRAHQRATALFQQAFEGTGVTPTQFAILSSLVRHGPSPQTVLSRLTAIDTATLSPMLTRLTEMGLVRRRSSVHDQRVNLVDVTAAGRRLTLRMLPVSDQVSAAVLDPVPEAERARFVELLRRVGSAPEAPEA